LNRITFLQPATLCKSCNHKCTAYNTVKVSICIYVTACVGGGS